MGAIAKVVNGWKVVFTAFSHLMPSFLAILIGCAFGVIMLVGAVKLGIRLSKRTRMSEEMGILSIMLVTVLILATIAFMVG